MNIIEQNPNRLLHLLTLFRMSADELLAKINKGLKKHLTQNDILGDQIKLSTLKKIDAIFNKGLSYYLDPTNPEKAKEESIFFRKTDFNADLNLSAKQVVNKYEEEKIRFSSLVKRSDFKLNRILKVYRVSADPKQVANEVRPNLYPEFAKEKREFLKNFISKLADFNILVYEFVEAPAKTEKANIDGFYLSPNVIVLKRAQKYFSREIFTLAHELGHYLLNEEDIDDKIYEDASVSVFHSNSNNVENWCNSFAYFFLAGEYNERLLNINYANSNNDYYTDLVKDISLKTHLSSISLYTHLLLNDRISLDDYNKVKVGILAQIKEREDREKEQRELERQILLAKGQKPFAQQPVPIISPLLLDTMRFALDTGLINEYDFCKRLNVNPKKIEEYYA